MTTPTEIEDRGGFLHLLPMHLSQSLAAVAIHASVLPWGSPALYALSGHAPDDPTAAVLELAYEWPTRWLVSAEPVGQYDLEWLHVQRFRSDYMLATRQLPFVNVRAGGDPPDVLVDTPEGTLGLACARLALQDRLGAYGLFQAVRQRIAQVPPEHFAYLHGHVVYLWFNDSDSSLTKPFRASDEAAAVDLVQELAAYRPSTGDLWITGNALPDPAPGFRPNRPMPERDFMLFRSSTPSRTRFSPTMRVSNWASPSRHVMRRRRSGNASSTASSERTGRAATGFSLALGHLIIGDLPTQVRRQSPRFS